MFTGIIEEIGKVERIQKDTYNCKLSIKSSKILEDIKKIGRQKNEENSIYDSRVCRSRHGGSGRCNSRASYRPVFAAGCILLNDYLIESEVIYPCLQE